MRPWFRVVATCVLLGAGSAAIDSVSAQEARPNTAAPAADGATSGVADLQATLQREKAAARAQMQAGRWSDAIPHAERALQATEALHGADAIESGVAAHNLGFLLRRAQRAPDAQAHLERALAVYERMRPAVHDDMRNLAGELGQLYQAAGRGAEVVTLYERLIARAGAEGNAAHAGVAHLHNNVAHVLRALGRRDESRQHWERALALYETQSSPEEEGYRLAIEGMLDLHQTLARTTDARALIARMLTKLTDAGQGHGRTASRLRTRLSFIEHQDGHFDEARRLALDVLNALDKDRPATTLDTVDPLNNLARAERALGNYAAAEPHYKRAIAILDAHGRAANAGIVRDNLAALYGHMGRRHDAEQLHKSALHQLEGALGREHASVGRAAANLGALLGEMGRLDEAEPLVRRGLAIAEVQTPPDVVALATIIDNLAGILRRTSRVPEARENVSRALHLFERALPANHPTLATAHNNLGRLLLDEGKAAEAETAFRRALDIAESHFGSDHVNIAVYASNLGEAFAASAKRDEARAWLRRALTVFERHFGATHASLVLTLTALGHVELADDRPGEAVAMFERAVAIGLAAGERAGQAAVVQREGRGVEQRALHGLLEGLWRLRATGGNAAHSDVGKAANSAEVTRSLDVAHWDTMTASSVALAALAARSATSAAGVGQPEFAVLIRERQDLTAEWRAKDKQLTELLSQSGARNVTLEKTLRGRLGDIEARQTMLGQDLRARFPRASELERPASLPIDRLQSLLRDDEAALQYVVTRDATFVWAITRRAVTWLRLPLGESDILAAVRGLRCGLDSAEWTRQGRQRCLRLLDVSEDKAPVDGAPLPFRLSRAHDLYVRLVAPVAAEIAAKDLLIVATGALTALPFQVLVTEAPISDADAAPDYAKAAWLGRRHAITVLPSLGSLEALRALAPSSRGATPYIGVGNPLLTGADGNDRRAWEKQSCATAVAKPAPVAIASTTTTRPGRLRQVAGAPTDALRRQTPLPETADEICQVAESVAENVGGSNGVNSDTVLLGEQATEQRLKGLSDAGTLNAARILHLATHGLLAGETEHFLNVRGEPALMLTPPETASALDDGLLTASEVAGLKLDADWVILSACNTASGDQVGAEALSGLARAFFHAGARSLLVSHWAVDSAATVKLVTTAFRAMAREPHLGQAKALRLAMLSLQDGDAREAHPSQWAPFIVVGSPSIVGRDVMPAGEAAVASPAPTLGVGTRAGPQARTPLSGARATGNSRPVPKTPRARPGPPASVEAGGLLSGQ